MATYVLINTVRIGTKPYFAGSLIDNSPDSVLYDHLVDAGAYLVPRVPNDVIDKAGERARTAHLSKGGNEVEFNLIMAAAAAQAASTLAQSALTTANAALPAAPPGGLAGDIYVLDADVAGGGHYTGFAKSATSGLYLGTSFSDASLKYLKHPAHLPKDIGGGGIDFIGTNFDPCEVQSAALLSAGVGASGIWFTEIIIPETRTITNLHVSLTVVGLTLTNCYAALYPLPILGAVPIRQTVDQSAAWMAGVATKTMVLTSPVSLTQGAYGFALWWNGGTSPTFTRRCANGNGTNVGRTATTARSGTYTPGSITTTAPTLSGGGNFGVANVEFFVGVS